MWAGLFCGLNEMENVSRASIDTALCFLARDML